MALKQYTERYWVKQAKNIYMIYFFFKISSGRHVMETSIY